MAHRKLAIIRRRVFPALSVLSLLLCVATLGLWAKSYLRNDILCRDYDRGASQTSVWLISDSGIMVIGVAWDDGIAPTSRRHDWEHWSESGLRFRAKEAFRYTSAFNYTLEGKLRYGRFPHWSLALLSAILPSTWLIGTIRSRRRHRAGHCPRCSYDLRATPERCPECGWRR